VEKRVPLVLLTGFLGSGKTTLLVRLLARRAARGATGKLGVIVNELGEVGIDSALIGPESARQIELPGGCVCCVLGDELDRTLLEIVDANPGLEAIVLETTGVAEPLPIAWALQRTPVAERVRLAAVVTLVDASNFRASRPLSVAVPAQVAYADVLLVTKADLVEPAELQAVESEIRTLASRALVWIRGPEEHAAWLEQVLADPDLERIVSDEARPNGEDLEHVHSDDCRHVEQPNERSAHGIDSVWVPVPGVVDLEELEDQLAALPGNYVRIKGIIHATDGRGGDPSARWTAVHRVGLRVSQEPIAAPEIEEGRLVALGPEVERTALAACVEAARS
jgi:G3E family GTPase